MNALLLKEKLDYFVCGRKANTAAVTFSLLASCIGGTATIGMIGLASKCGWPAFWWLGSGSIGLLILGLFLAKKIRATRALTLSQIIEEHMGHRCQLFASLMIVLSNIAIVAAQFNALGLLLNSLFHLDFKFCIWTGAICVTGYTFVGGQRTVIHSDSWQLFIFASGFLLALGYLLYSYSFQAFLNFPPEIYNDQLSMEKMVYFLLVFGSSFIIGPMIVGRLLSAQNPMVAKKATLWASGGLAIMALVIVAIGISLTVCGLDPDAGDRQIFDRLLEVLPTWLSFYLSLGLLCAIISSADSCLLTAATIWSHDLQKNGTIFITRLVTLVISLCSVILVFSGKGILGLLLAASDIYVGGIIAPVMLVLLFNRKNQSFLLFLGMITGGSCGFISAYTGNFYWSFAGIGASFALALTSFYKIA